MKVEFIYKISVNELVEKAIKIITNSYCKNKKPTGKYFDQLKKVVEVFNQQPTNKDQKNS